MPRVVGIAAGAIQGYFGGWTDLLFQRFIEIWSSLPSLYLLIILSAIVAPSFRLIQELHLQMQNLRRTSDLLLPRLLSGRISLTTKENHANA